MIIRSIGKAGSGIGLVGFFAGAVCLAVGLASIAFVLPTMAGATIYRIEIPRSMFLASLAVAVVFFAVAGRLWWGALKRTEGDDLLTE
jgi:CDP-diglyceride synthetase